MCLLFSLCPFQLIGGGLCSRCLISKGSLRFVERIGPAGHVLKVFDSAFNHVKNAEVSVENKTFKADDSGEILIPFRNDGSSLRTSVILIDKKDGFTSLANFSRKAETYELNVGYV